MEETISIDDFEANCLDLLDRVERRELQRLAITSQGEILAIMTPPPAREFSVDEGVAP